MDGVKLFGIPFFAGSIAEALATVLKAADGTAKTVFIVFTPNTEQVMLSRRDPEFFHNLQRSDLNLPDSEGVIWAGGQLGIANFPMKRIAGREFVEAMLPHLAQRKKKLFILGGVGDTAGQAAEVLRTKFSGLRIAWSSGALNAKHETTDEHMEILKKIQEFQPEVLFVAYGAPAQERWILENREALAKAGVKVVMVVGGALDVISGKLMKPLQAVSSAKLEWLWRLVQQPWRLKRQIALAWFMYEVFQEKSRTHP